VSGYDFLKSQVLRRLKRELRNFCGAASCSTPQVYNVTCLYPLQGRGCKVGGTLHPSVAPPMRRGVCFSAATSQLARPYQTYQATNQPWVQLITLTHPVTQSVSPHACISTMPNRFRCIDQSRQPKTKRYFTLFCKQNYTELTATISSGLSSFLPATAGTAIARIRHRNSVCPSVRHTGGSGKNGAS